MSAATGSFPALAVGRGARSASTELRSRAAGARASGRAASHAASRAAEDGRRDWSPVMREGVSSALLLTRNAAAAAPDSRLPRRVRRQPGSAPPSSTRGTRTPPPASRGTATRWRCGTPPRGARPRAARGSRLPRPARSGSRFRSADVLDGIGRRGGPLSADRGRRLRRRDHDHRPLAEGMHAALRRRHALRPGEGRRDDRARLRDDALLRPDGRRRRRPRGGPPGGRRGLVRADHRRRADEHQRHGRCSRRAARAGARCPTACSTRRCSSSRSRSSPTARAPPAPPGSRSSRRPRPTRPSGSRGRSPTRRW